MDKLLRRLKFYGIGFGLGLIFIFFFFQNRGCSWLPGNRVKNAILDRVLVVSDEVRSEMNTLKLSDSLLIQALNDGDILFSESDKNEATKCYIIESGDNKYGFTLPQESFVSEAFIANNSNKFKISEKGYGEMIRFPLDENLVYIDTNELVSCQKDMLGIENPKEALKLIKLNGRINFSESDFSVEPKAEHIIEFEKNGKLVKAKVVWYKNKLDVLNLQFSGSEQCAEKSELTVLEK